MKPFVFCFFAVQISVLAFFDFQTTLAQDTTATNKSFEPARVSMRVGYVLLSGFLASTDIRLSPSTSALIEFATRRPLAQGASDEFLSLQFTNEAWFFRPGLKVNTYTKSCKNCEVSLTFQMEGGIIRGYYYYDRDWGQSYVVLNFHREQKTIGWVSRALVEYKWFYMGFGPGIRYKEMSDRYIPDDRYAVSERTVKHSTWTTFLLVEFGARIPMVGIKNWENSRLHTTEK